VLDNGKSVEYNYDYHNRLVCRNDELFLHDGWQIACSLRNGRIEHRYLWGAMQDELLAMDDAWTLRDHLNTVRDVINMNGKVVSHLEYNAFGKLVSSTGEKLPFRYTAKMFDDATGLQWNINRWYDPNVGRWVSEDPIGFMAKDGNLARYVENRALAVNDVFGLTPKDTFLAAFNDGWTSATQRKVPGQPNVALQFTKMFGINEFMGKLSDNLLGYPYQFQFGQNPGAMASYSPFWNTFAFPPNISGVTAIHEAAHGYNDTKLGFWSADADEALAYMLDGLVTMLGVGTSVDRWEERLDGSCPVGDAESMRLFMNRWNGIWSSVNALSDLGITVTYLWGETNRQLTEQDYLNLEIYYGIRISCEAYKTWSLDTIKKQWSKTCNTDCIKLTCPDALWSVFQ